MYVEAIGARDESILLTGPYTPLIELFASVNPELLTLEFSTPRAGELSSLLSDPRISGTYSTWFRSDKSTYR